MDRYEREGQLVHANAILNKQIDEFWEFLPNHFEIETKEELEAEAKNWNPQNPLIVALHHIWKRDPIVDSLRAEVEQANTNYKTSQELVKKLGGELERIVDVANEQTANCDAHYDRAEKAEADVLEQIDIRDRWEERATNLAELVGEHFNLDVGEHSNLNCPIAEADGMLRDHVCKSTKSAGDEFFKAEAQIGYLSPLVKIQKEELDEVHEQNKVLREALEIESSRHREESTCDYCGCQLCLALKEAS